MTPYQKALLALVRRGVHQPHDIWAHLKQQGFWWAQTRFPWNVEELTQLGYLERVWPEAYRITGRGCIVLLDP